METKTVYKYTLENGGTALISSKVTTYETTVDIIIQKIN